MSTFLLEWLTLRQPHDLAARNRDVEAAFLAALPTGPVRILDLGSGAGATLAALAGILTDAGHDRQQWSLADHDRGLLRTAASRFGHAPGVHISAIEVDLAADLETLPFGAVDAVTTSAFLDLVDHGFVDRLTTLLRAHRLPFLASLTYDGRMDCDPPDPTDRAIRQVVNRHQRTDKGFGLALGPEAADVTQDLLERAGFKVITGRSDWRLSPQSREIQAELVRGWAAAAKDIGLSADDVNTWADFRQAAIERSASAMTVGHVDLAALPIRSAT
ncbi:MAG: glycosyl transferase family 1 [Roseibium sp.]|nr:glycosyl transferase family 1 [Roseibium sp.]